jgi:hypothetical protein
MDFRWKGDKGRRGERRLADMRDIYLKDLQCAIIMYCLNISGDKKYKGDHVRGIVDKTLEALYDDTFT